MLKYIFFDKICICVVRGAALGNPNCISIKKWEDETHNDDLLTQKWKEFMNKTHFVPHKITALRPTQISMGFIKLTILK